MNSGTRLAIALAAVIGAGYVIDAITSPVRSHDIYRQWSPPGNPNTSCCNDSDCRATTAYMHDDGLWRAWNGLEWLIVPKDRVLPTDHAGDGRSHLCEKGGFVYCFSPTETKG